MQKALGCPRFFDRPCEIVGDVERKSVIVAIIEPARELLTRIDFHHVDIEFPLVFETGKREIAAAKKTDVRMKRVFSVDEVKFGVETFAEMKFDFDASIAKLPREMSESRLVVARRDAHCELTVEVFGDVPSQLKCALLIDGGCRCGNGVKSAPKLFGGRVHADEQAARCVSFVVFERVYRLRKEMPAAKVEIAHANVCTSRAREGLQECGGELLLDVVEDSGHGAGRCGDGSRSTTQREEGCGVNVQGLSLLRLRLSTAPPAHLSTTRRSRGAGEVEPEALVDTASAFRIRSHFGGACMSPWLRQTFVLLCLFLVACLLPAAGCSCDSPAPALVAQHSSTGQARPIWQGIEVTGHDSR